MVAPWQGQWRQLEGLKKEMVNPEGLHVELIVLNVSTTIYV